MPTNFPFVSWTKTNLELSTLTGFFALVVQMNTDAGIWSESPW